MRLHAFVCLAVLVSPALAGDDVRLSESQRAASGIGTTPVEPADDLLTIPYPGQVVVPNENLQLVSAPQEGIVEAMLVAEGEHVSRDQPLVRIRSPQLLEMQRMLVDSANQLKLASDRVVRDQSLFEDGIISYRRLLESRAEQQRMSAMVRQQRETLRIAGMSDREIAELEAHGNIASAQHIVSPLDGVILDQHATVGQHVQTADPLYRIGNLDRLWLEIHVPLSVASSVGEGNGVRINDPRLTGRVITIGRMVHEEDQGVMVRAEITEDVERLRPGQFVQVSLAIGAAGNAVRVPTAALVRDGRNAFVFVERGDRLTVVAVEVLAEESASVVVTGAIETKDKVVSRGVAAVKAAWKSQSAQ